MMGSPRAAFSQLVPRRSPEIARHGLLPAHGTDGDGAGPRHDAPPRSGAREDLPYRVELWTQDRTAVEQVLAETASASIGFAAYYAAVREYPTHTVTLRHKNTVVTRSN